MENLNDPFMVLSFLQSRYAGRFTWTLVGRDAEVGRDVWRLRYLERERPTGRGSSR